MSEVSPVTVVPVATAAEPTTLIVPKKADLATTLASIKRDTVVGGLSIPDYVKEGCESADGLDMMGDMVTPPRLKVVQALSKDMKALGFSEGDMVVTPINVKVGDEANPLDVVVLLSWAEYLCINPREATDLFWLRDRTIDSKSQLAAKCRNRVKEPLPEGGLDKNKQPLQIEYAKASNFLVWLVDHNMAVVVTFLKGEGKYGDAFASLVNSRNLAVYSGMYQMKCVTHQNKRSDQWKGISVGNSPSNQAFCPRELLQPMKELYHSYREQWANQNINVNYDDLQDDPAERKADVGTTEY